MKCEPNNNNEPRCTHCPGVLFGYNSKCVSICPTGTYQSTLNGNKVCADCIDNCNVCNDGITCTICEYGFYGINGNTECKSIC